MLDKMEAVARNALSEARELIVRHIGRVSGESVENKGPADYVTEIDKKSESIIIGAVREKFPDHHIMAEESANDGLQSGYTWVIDPVDGTTNFIHGFPFVAVSIAVCFDKKPVLGFVLDVVRNELFSARKGEGAWVNGSRLRRLENVEVGRALIATGFPFRSKQYLDPYLSAFRSIFMNVSGIRRAGSAALDLAYVAAGRVDGFWEIGLKAWDIAAGSLLISETGGSVSDFQGGDNHLVSGNVVAGGPLVYPFLLEQMKKHLVPVLDAGH